MQKIVEFYSKSSIFLCIASGTALVALISNLEHLSKFPNAGAIMVACYTYLSASLCLGGVCWVFNGWEPIVRPFMQENTLWQRVKSSALYAIPPASGLCSAINLILALFTFSDVVRLAASGVKA